MRTTAWLLAVSLFPASSFAHHSVPAGFDPQRTIELEGKLTELRWQNPHVRLAIEVAAEGGGVTTWELETLSANGLGRTGIAADLFVLGDRIKVAGFPSRRGATQLWVNNLLLPTNQEIVMAGAQRGPRWSSQVLRGSEATQGDEGVAANAELGIFRVWSSGRNFRMNVVNIATPNDPSSFPLTAEGRTAVATLQQPEDPSIRCVPKRLPRAMMQPYPIEFVRVDDQTIALKVEEYDIVRTIHVGAPEARSADVAPSPLGYSTGQWDGMTLVVTTTRLESDPFSGLANGRIPFSDEARLVERFSPGADGARLEYRLTVTDTRMLTEPVALERAWINVPGSTVLPYDCRQ